MNNLIIGRYYHILTKHSINCKSKNLFEELDIIEYTTSLSVY